MWHENERYVESKARTSKLWCSDCRKKINKGEPVTFLLDTKEERMKEVYCCVCKEDYVTEVVTDTRHIFDIDY